MQKDPWTQQTTSNIIIYILIILFGGYYLRKLVKEKLNDKINIFYPDIELCTDNAAMIAFLAEVYLKEGIRSNISFEAIPNLKLQ